MEIQEIIAELKKEIEGIDRAIAALSATESLNSYSERPEARQTPSHLENTSRSNSQEDRTSLNR